MLCKDSKQHHVMFHELYSVSSLLCIAQNVRFEIPYKDLYFETPFLMIFKYYAWASYGKDTLNGVRFVEDFTPNDFETRKKALPIMKQAFEDGKKVRFTKGNYLRLHQ